MAALEEAIQAIRVGDRDEGRRLLEEILETQDSNEQVWLWLCAVVDTDEDREVCLENVLALNPNNSVAKRGLEAMRSGSFNVNQMMSEVVEEEDSGETFLEEFERTSQGDEEDDELAMPSTMKGKGMAKGKTTAKKSAKEKSGGSKINLRLIILAVVAVVIICLLGSMAAYSFIGGSTSDQQPTGQETPSGGQAPALPTDTPTPTSTPTHTPTPTKTPLLLPTAKPTEPPTPTATLVVAPTP
jgi:hypothetical protein